MSHLKKLVIGSVFGLILLVPVASHATATSDIQTSINGLLGFISQLQTLVGKPPAGQVGVSPTCLVYSNKASAAVNESFTVTWYAANADYVKDINGKDSTTGSLKVNATKPGTYTYSVTAVAKNGTATCATNVSISTATSTKAVVNNDGANATLSYNAQNPSLSYGTYMLKFDVTAVGGDIYLPRAASTSDSALVGIVYGVTGTPAFSGIMNSALTSTADVYNSGFFVIRSGQTEVFTLTSVLDPSASGYYAVGLKKLNYNAQPVAPNQKVALSLQTDSLYIPNAGTSTTTASAQSGLAASALVAVQSVVGTWTAAIHRLFGIDSEFAKALTACAPPKGRRGAIVGELWTPKRYLLPIRSRVHG